MKRSSILLKALRYPIFLLLNSKIEIEGLRISGMIRGNEQYSTEYIRKNHRIFHDIVMVTIYVQLCLIRIPNFAKQKYSLNVLVVDNSLFLSVKRCRA